MIKVSSVKFPSLIRVRDRLLAPLEHPDQAERLLVETFRTLSSLCSRLADVVESQLEDYLRCHGIEETWGTQERILVCITPRSNATAMIDSGRRNADRFKGELYVLYVRQSGLSLEDQAALDRNLAIAVERGGIVSIVENDDPVQGVIHFAREHGITQIFIGHSIQQGWLQSFKKSVVERLIELAEGIDVRLFPQ